MARLPEVVSRFAEAPFPLNYVPGGEVSPPVVHEVPPGSVAVVALHAWFLTSYDISAAGISFTPHASLVPTLTDLAGGSARSVEISESGQSLRFLSKLRPAHLIVQPAGTRLTWQVRIDYENGHVTDYPDAHCFLWLRAIVLEASIPQAELLRLLGTGLQ